MNQIVSRGHTRPLTEISFVQDGPDRILLASSAHDKLPQLRNGDTGDWLGTFHGHKGAVWSIKVDKFSRTLAVTASGDFTAKLWCVSTGKEIFEFKHNHVVKSVDFSNNTKNIATGSQDGYLKIFDTIKPDASPISRKVSQDMADAITKINWVNDNNGILVAKRSGIVELWDVRDNQQSASNAVALTSKDTVIDIEVNDDKDIILAANGTHVTTVSLSKLEIIRQYDMPSPMKFTEEGGASLSPDGTKFLAGASDLWLREFDIKTGQILQTFKGHHGPIRCVRYHPSGNIGASGSEDATIRLWDLNCNNTQLEIK